MKQIFLTLAAILGALSVAAGAFGTHSLRGQIADHMLLVFEVGTRYQMYHALALLAVAVLLNNNSLQANKTLVVSGWLFITGIFLFSGSLYALSLTSASNLGIITPFGGAALIAGWIALAISNFEEKGKE